MRTATPLFIVPAALGLLTCMLARQPRPAPPGTVFIRAGHVAGLSQNYMAPGVDILIKGDTIAAAGDKLPVPPDARFIDLENATVLPGLIDAHTHITYHFDKTGHFGLASDSSRAEALRYAAENARETLLAGFTTIRNLGAGGGIDIELRNEIEHAQVYGPRIIASGAPLLPDFLQQSDNEQARLESIRSFVRQRVAEGADVIKLFEGVDDRGHALLNEAEVRAAVDEAAKSGRRVSVHAHEAAAIKAAVNGGCASIEHGSFADSEAIRLMVLHHTALVPTLYLPTYYLEHRSQFAFDDSTWEFFQKLRDHNLENVRHAKLAGVWIVAGSDAVSGVDGHNARELEWLVKAGLTPQEAIRSATTESARLLGMSGRIGEIKPGAFADLIGLDGNPLSDITSLQKIRFVMKGGIVIKDEHTNEAVVNRLPLWIGLTPWITGEQHNN